MRQFLFILLLSPLLTLAQNGNITGTVLDEENHPVPFANVGLTGTKYGATTDDNGKYTINNIEYGTYKLEVSFIGFLPVQQKVVIDKNEVKVDFQLESSAEILDEFVVTGTMKEMSMLESPVPVEVFTPAYFEKNPTPALFEALQIVNGVRPQINCSVCNTGDVHINGMEGPYTMVLIDGMPVVGGLSSVYGLNGIPNALVERIEVIKGPASTLYGSEAVGGIINVITNNPDNIPIVSLDLFGTSWQEYNTDLGVKFKLGKAQNLLGVNYFNYTNPIDNNGDNFTDVTNSQRLSIFDKVSFDRKENRVVSIAIRYVTENRWGGEMQWTPEFRGGDSIYGESIITDRFEMIGKYQLPTKEKLFLNFSASDHYQDSYYGDLPYMANEKIGFGQLLWDKQFGAIHSTLFGLSTRVVWYDDDTPATYASDSSGNNPNFYVIPGVFVQDEIEFDKKKKLLLGLRYDYHSHHGSILAPRLNYKWTPNNMNTIRVSFGNGFRVVNLFTEDHAALTGAREVVILEDLNPERSYNLNVSYQKFINTKFGFIDLELNPFYTYFTNKITPDYETDDKKIIYKNLDGYAISRGVSVTANVNFEIPLKINAGITAMDVFEIDEDENGQSQKNKQLLTENFSGTWTATYTFDKIKTSIDYTGNVYGPMKLPVVENDPRPEYSDWYSIQNLKVTKEIKGLFEIYGGVKNILDFTPPANSILRAHDPFDKTADDLATNPYGNTFDPSYVYAPNQGRRFFFGVRFKFK